MIVLDTNVLSEMMRPSPSPVVFSWLASQPRAILFTTTINQAEILYGIAMLDDGRRKRGLAAAKAMFQEEFAGRLLPFGDAAAAHYARLVVARRKTGSPSRASMP